MTKLSNNAICQEDTINVMLPAEKIPDQARVAKVGGEQPYILRHNLILWGTESEADPKKAVEVTGHFLVNERGDINQVPPGKVLRWLVTAEDLVDMLVRSWETEGSQ